MDYVLDLPGLRTASPALLNQIAMLNERYTPELPEWLGIATMALGGRYRCVLTDVRHHQVLDVLENRWEHNVASWLFKRKSPNLKVVTMHMWQPFKMAVQGAFPSVPIVIDKFCVVQMANKALDDVRIKLSKSMGLNCANRKLLLKCNRALTNNEKAQLNRWLGNNPDLATAYFLKERFFSIYDQVRHAEAKSALDEWRSAVPRHMHKYFGKLLAAINTWETEILACFDHRETTNAFTESLNSVTRVVDRQNRGYDFEVLRGRILFGRQLESDALNH